MDRTRERKAREAFDRNPFPDLPWIRVREDGIAIATGYSEALHRLLRWVPKAEWRAAERCWLVPFSGAEAVRAVLPEITRLAETARELDAPVAPAAPGLLEALVEGAALLHGPDWRAVLARDGDGGRIADWVARRAAPDPSDPLLVDLAAALRKQAAALTRAAEQLGAHLSPLRGDDRT
jgi:hypothetical protein